MSFFNAVLTGVAAVTLVGGGLVIVPEEVRDGALAQLGLVAESEESGQSYVAGLLSDFFGGDSERDARVAAYEEAVRVGTPLDQANISPEERTEFARLGSNVVVDCAGPAGHAEVTELNNLLAQAPGAQLIACGAYSPDAPVVSIPAVEFTAVAHWDGPEEQRTEFEAAGYDLVGECQGEQGVLASVLADAGGSAWACGYNSADL